MACVACRGELCGDVIGIRRGLEILEVAGSASCRHGLELAVGRAFVTGIAVHRRVRSGQREAIIVLLYLLNRNLPPSNGVASLAIRSQLPLVNIGVAVLAALADIAEDRFYVTLNAGHRLVHSAQGITRPVVIEFRNGPDRCPPTCSVAILAGNIQVSVRTASSAGHLRLRRTRVRGEREERHCYEVEDGPST
jgi:hypothetical protein